MIKKFIYDLKHEFKGYNATSLSSDLLSGFTVAAVALPLALAFGVSSGADAAAGLITAILAGLVIGFLSGSSFQISGPTGAMTAILITVVAKYGIQGVFLSTVMAGIILIVAGMLKVGKIVSIIPMPVITGFTSGIAIIIALGQIDNFFGTTSVGDNVVSKLASYGHNGFTPLIGSVFFGVLVMLIMIFWPKKFGRYLPASLMSIIIVLIINNFINLDVPTVGAIPRTLLPETRLSFSSINFSSLSNLIIPAFSIAALGMIESLLCGTSAGRMKGETLDANRELVAQGIGNILLPFFGGVPATAAIARTSVAIKSGQKTRLTSIFHSVGLIISMFLLSSVMSEIPMSALAGVLMMTAWRMNEWESIKYLVNHKLKGAICGFLITMAATVFFDLSIAILAGLVSSCIIFVIKTSNNMEVTISVVDPDRMIPDIGISNEQHKHIRVVYISGALFFGNTNALIKKLESIESECTTLILSIRGLSSIDSTGIYSLLEFYQESEKKGVEIYFTGIQNKVMKSFEKGGFTNISDVDHFQWSTQDVLNVVLG